MAHKNSRRKGAKNERNLAKAFEQWTGRKFAKSPASGGLHWKSSHVAGDIVCCKEGHYFPFCIEGKSYSKIDFSHLLNPKIKNCDILDFWSQAKRDAKEVNKIPMLLMRYNSMPKDFWFLVVTQDYAKSLHELLPKDMVTLRYHDYKTNTALMIFRSTDFFKIPYKQTKILTKKYIKDGNNK